MRIILGLVLALAVGCGDTTSPANDMQPAQDCPPLDAVGSPCNPACTYQGYPCGCSKAGVVTCSTRDMATHD